MSGIDYGKTYKLTTSLRDRKEGVVFMPKIGKYLVRVKKQGTIKTMSAHVKKFMAEREFERVKDKYKPVYN